jgi:hypothetical protein
MSTGTRSQQEKKRREGTADTEELPRTDVTQIHQMMENMADQITKHVARQFSALSARLEKLEIQTTVAPAPTIPASAPASAPAPSMDVQPRWRPEEIGEFDPTVRDVMEFTDRIRDIALLRGQRLVATNLVTLLTGQAKMWYNYELSSSSKLAMQQGPIDQWINALVARFTPSKSETLQALEKQRYTRQDAANKRDPVDYLHQVLQLTKRLGYSEHEGLTMAYLRLDEALQVQFPPPHEMTGISNMVMLLNVKKGAWYQMYKNFGRPPHSEKSSYSQPIRSNYQPTRPSPRQVSYPAAAHFADDGWDYDPVNDTYHAAVQPPHPPGHTPRNQGNTHDGSSAYANWVNASADHRCSHTGCTHYHD